MMRGHWRFLLLAGPVLIMSGIALAAYWGDQRQQSHGPCRSGEILVKSVSQGYVCVPGRRAE